MRFKSELSLLAGWLTICLLSTTALAATGDLRLAEAVKNKDKGSIATLLKQRVNVNTPLADGSTALAWAAHWDDLETADLLIRAGANASAANDYGVTPLSLACEKGSTAMVEKLLKAGANPNVPEWTGETPLMTCARTGNAEAVKMLLEHHADANAKESRRGQTALMWAVAEKHPEAIRVLIEHGADVNARSHMLGGFEPLLFITYGVHRRVRGKPETFEPSDVHQDPVTSKGGFTALMFAAQQGDMETAGILLAAGAKVNDASPDYGSALTIAAASGREEVADLLLDKGAEPNVADGWGFTPLHYALQGGIAIISMNRPRMRSDRLWQRPNLPNLVKALLAHGANPNARVGKGLPPFNYPAFARSTGNSMPQIRQPGATPFFLAAASLDVSLMRLLIAGGADPLITTDEGTTPLMVAAGVGREEEPTKAEEQNSLEAVKLAAELGGDVNAANGDGRTALHGAAYLGLNDVIQFLASKGAKLEMKDMYGQSALSIAQGVPSGGGDKRFRGPHARKPTAELLLQAGATALPAKAAIRSETASTDPAQ